MENSSLVLNETTGDLVSEAVFRAVGGLSILVMIIGIPGNFLVIASIIVNKHMRTTANFLVFNLSIFDFLFLCTMVPVHAYCYLTGWQPSPSSCWTIGFITNWLLSCSIMSTGSIAVNRYIAIVLKSKYRQISGEKVGIVTCIIVFIAPLILLSPTFEGSYGTFGWEKQDRNCGWKGLGLMKAVFIGCVAIFPLVFMTLCYIWIVLYVLASKKRVGAIAQTTTTGAPNFNKEARMTLMLALVYVVHALTTLPSVILNATGSMGIDIPYSSLILVFVVVWISSAANPVMYGLVNKKYRDAYKNVIVKMRSITSRSDTQSLETAS